MACFSTRASVTTVLTMHPCVSWCSRVNGAACDSAKRMAYLVHKLWGYELIPILYFFCVCVMGGGGGGGGGGGMTYLQWKQHSTQSFIQQSLNHSTVLHLFCFFPYQNDVSPLPYECVSKQLHLSMVSIPKLCPIFGSKWMSQTHHTRCWL